jgi:hypothetical protein
VGVPRFHDRKPGCGRADRAHARGALQAELEEGGILARLAVGFVHARERKPALPALAMVATLSLFGVSHSAILSVFAEHELGSARYFPWMVVATGAGAMLGALSIGYRSRGRRCRAAALMLAYSVAMGVFSTARALPLALGSQFVIGWTYFAVMTSLQTLIQQIVHESKRGRVMSLFQVAWAGLVPWGGLGMGAAASAIGETSTLAIARGSAALRDRRARVVAQCGRRDRAGIRRPAVLNPSPMAPSWKLLPHATSAGVTGPVVACVLDGVGIGAHDESDAVWLARTPNLDFLARHALATSLCAHGTAWACRATTTWATARSGTTRSARAGSSTRAPSS